MATIAIAAESRLRKLNRYFNPRLFPSPDSAIVRELGIEAFTFLTEADYWIDRYNEVVSELHKQEYNQFNFSYGIKGLSCDIKPELVQSLLQEGPTPSGFKEYHHDRPLGLPEETPARKTLAELRSELGEPCGWVCIYCAKQGDVNTGPDKRQWHVDHLYPKSRGGDNEPDNLVLSCATCNLQKSAKLLSDAIAAKAVASVA